MHEAVVEKVRGCRKCPLGSLHHGPVPFEGKRGASFLFLGSSPTDRDVGVNWLKKELRGLGIPKWDWGYGCAVSCKVTANNGVVKQWELDACSSVLTLQVSSMRPRAVILCGATAMKAYRPDWDHKKMIGWFFAHQGRLFAVAPHLMMAQKEFVMASAFRSIVRRVRKRVRGPKDLLIHNGSDWPNVCSVCGGELEAFDEMGVPYCHRDLDLVGREKRSKQLTIV